MTDLAPALSTIVAKVNGTPVSEALMSLLVRARAETSLDLPGRFELAFRDEYSSVVAALAATPGAAVELSVLTNEGGAKPVFSGEVTALETEFGPEGTRTVVRGYEKTHRLQFGRATKTFVNVTYSDVARKLIGDAGLAVGTVGSDSAVRDWVAQPNVSDWELLAAMAAEIGFVVSCTDGKVNFSKPAAASSAPAKGTLEDFGGAKLVRGANLLRARIVVSGAQQVSEVSVGSWDDNQKQALLGRAPAGAQSFAVSGAGWDPASTAARFGSKPSSELRLGLDSQSLNQTRAKALADQVGGSGAELEGTAFGDPALHAGSAVSIGGLGAPFDGKYVLSSACHDFDWDGYRTSFTSSGRHDRSLLGLAAGGGAAPGPSGFGAYGLVSAIVTNNNDAEKSLNRVKVKIPALADNFETDWVPVVQAGAGASRGALWHPEVDDLVLVAFLQDDIRRPVVVGGMHNGKDKPKIAGASLVKEGKVVQRGFVSRAGHTLIFSDDDSKQSVTAATSDNNHTLVLDQTGLQITITSKGKVTISGAQDVTVKSDTNLTLQGMQVKITAEGPLQLQGATVKVASDGPLEATGAIIKLN
ncbi:MAG: VgrG-related protein [Acidimicrobiales bacterium]